MALQQGIVDNDGVQEPVNDEVLVPCQPAVESVIDATDRPTARGTVADNCAECGRR